MKNWFVPIYDFLLIIASFGYIVKYALRGRINSALLERIFIPKEKQKILKSLERPIWIHAVSVGEINIIKEFLERLRPLYPDTQVIISTITPQGMELASSLYKDKAFLFYLPLDLSFLVKKLLSLVRPKALLVMETEIWPNLYHFLYKRGIPIIIFNGRISDRSFKRYSAVKSLLKPVLRQVSFVACQDEVAEERFFNLGANPDLIRITGNMKFKSVKPDRAGLDNFSSRWREYIKGNNLLIVAGSTHDPEEEYLLSNYREIIREFPGVNLLICPRHIQRAGQIANLTEKAGFMPLRLSNADKSQASSQKRSVFILDTIGELIYSYSLADIVFVGGSLVSHGGQNILEPAYFSKPVVFGKYMSNFTDIRNSFIDNNAAIEVESKDELQKALLRLMRDKELREGLGQRAKGVINSARDSVEENLNIVRKFL